MSGLYRKIGIHAIDEQGQHLDSDHLALETVIRLSDQDGVFTTLLATPSQLEELFIGHCITEGYGNEVKPDVDVSYSEEDGYTVCALDYQINQKGKSRPTKIVSTSCGACNSPSLDLLLRDLPPYIGSHQTIKLGWLNASFERMKHKQIGFLATGGMHAAALFSTLDDSFIVCEDIGRHNAVDKVVGKSVMGSQGATESILFLSGRCGWDIVAKSARAGIGTIACIGACSSLAADTARALGMRIYSFVKPERSIGIGQLHPSTKDNP